MTGPALAGAMDDVDGWRWVDRGEFEQLCSGEFWWPLVPVLFDELSPKGPSVAP